ncbi:MAG: hypothetical protein JSV85_00805 [Candidatus Bathyarchaeota archaeon]|nr:MAG: hypothetical protein JSV85_00805 [Candidatus Bathyarchaeota archaeon]
MIARRTALSFLSLLVGYSILGIYAFSLRSNFVFPTEAYWLSFVFVSLPLLFEVALWRSSQKLRLLYLFTFSLMINLQYAVVDSSPILSSEDAVADYRLAGKIIADSEWLPFGSVEWGFGSEYRFYPITDFLYATMSLLTGIPLLIVVKYLFIVKALVAPPITQKFFQRFFTQRIAYLATALFLASPGAILYPHKESFAVIFFLLGMYAATRIEKARQYPLVGFICVTTLIMTHHFTSYIFMGLLSALFIASSYYGSRKAARVSGQFLLLCLSVFASWVAFIAWAIVAAHQRFVSEVFFETLLPGRVSFSEVLPLYTAYERAIVWLGLGITVVSTILGFVGYLRDKRGFSSSFFAITVFLVPLLFVASVFRFSSRSFNVLISHRFYEFGYIIVGAFSALFFTWAFKFRKKLSLRVIVTCVAVVMIVVGPMTGAMHPRTFSKVSKVVSSRALSLNTWMNEFSSSNEYTVGDQVVYIILSIYGESKATRHTELLVAQNFSLLQEERVEWAYVVTHVYMADFYGLNATKFSNSPDFHTLYSNGLLTVYRRGS